MAPSTTSREFFELLYRERSDPWGFADDAYELDRYRRILEHVPAGRFPAAFEPGCSIGVLTRELTTRCDRVIAIDIAESAVESARRRCADRPGAEIARGALPSDLPADPVDLVVLSEIGYYFDRGALTELVRRIRSLLRPGGRVVAAHWTGASSDHVLRGHDVHQVLGEHLDLSHHHHHHHHHHQHHDHDHQHQQQAVHRRPGHDDVEQAFVLDVWDLAP